MSVGKSRKPTQDTPAPREQQPPGKTDFGSNEENQPGLDTPAAGTDTPVLNAVPKGGSSDPLMEEFKNHPVVVEFERLYALGPDKIPIELMDQYKAVLDRFERLFELSDEMSKGADVESFEKSAKQAIAEATSPAELDEVRKAAGVVLQKMADKAHGDITALGQKVASQGAAGVGAGELTELTRDHIQRLSKIKKNQAVLLTPQKRGLQESLKEAAKSLEPVFRARADEYRAILKRDPKNAEAIQGLIRVKKDAQVLMSENPELTSMAEVLRYLEKAGE
jgi:hypothetical protein